MNENKKRAHERPAKSFAERAGDFFEGKGFYIVLFLCVAAIGISGYVIFSGDGADVPSAVSEGAADVSLDSGVITETFPSDSPAGASDPASSGAISFDTAALDADSRGATARGATARGATALEETALAAAAEASGVLAPDTAPAEPAAVRTTASLSGSDTFFMRPVPGAVAANFSGDRLAYSETMGDWRTHNGIDIAAAKGEPVKAIADGVVKSVDADAYDGVTVTIEHAGGCTAKYGNLQKTVFVVPNQSVEAGDTIGGVGDTMLTESKQSPHLHLEVWRDGAAVDPQELLPKPAN